MNRNKKGQWIKEISDPVLMSFYVEYADRDWLRDQALKRKITMGAIIRSWIRRFKK